MIIHQIDNSLNYDIFNAFIYKDGEWYEHIHKSFEIIYVLEGIVEVTLNGQKTVLHKDELIFIPPFFAHSIKSIVKESLYFIVVFSRKYIGEFGYIFDNKIPEENKFCLHKEELNYFLSKGINNDTTPRKINISDEISIKQLIFVLISEFVKQTNFVPSSGKLNLVSKVINYIENNFSSNISLLTMSNELGYDYKYLSKLINKIFGYSISYIINQYRIDRAIELINNTSDSFTNISLSCGFATIRNFNRIFKTITGFTPSDLRK